eukprot:6492467-Amphidinium_carterae.2
MDLRVKLGPLVLLCCAQCLMSCMAWIEWVPCSSWPSGPLSRCNYACVSEKDCEGCSHIE